MKTVQIDTATNMVSAIVLSDVSTPAPAGKLFVKVEGGVIVECRWTYDPQTGLFSPPVED